jgi:Mobilization protein NikA
LAPEERAKIENNAAAMGLSTSAYVRTLGLSYEPRPILERSMSMAFCSKDG